MYGIGAITHPMSAISSPACQKPILWNWIVTYASAAEKNSEVVKKTVEILSSEVVKKNPGGCGNKSSPHLEFSSPYFKVEVAG